VKEETIKKMAKDLKKGHGLVVSGSNNVGVQVLVNKLNSLVGAYESTINVNNPIQLFASEDGEMMNLANDVAKGKGPDAVFFYNTNPAYSLPNGDAFAEGISKLKLSVSTAAFADETAS
jgi:molybdopterin-containing oxidoreductase family iron-sulfur binding subunit